MASDFERFVDWSNFLGISPRRALDRANKVFCVCDGNFGIEHIELEDMYEFYDDEPEMWYLNTGDTYSETIIATDDYVNGEKLLCTTLGDWYDEQTRWHEEDRDVIRCGYCGKFTPKADPYDATICEFCEHKYS